MTGSSTGRGVNKFSMELLLYLWSDYVMDKWPLKKLEFRILEGMEGVRGDLARCCDSVNSGMATVGSGNGFYGDCKERLNTMADIIPLDFRFESFVRRFLSGEFEGDFQRKSSTFGKFMAKEGPRDGGSAAKRKSAGSGRVAEKSEDEEEEENKAVKKKQRAEDAMGLKIMRRVREVVKKGSTDVDITRTAVTQELLKLGVVSEVRFDQVAFKEYFRGFAENEIAPIFQELLAEDDTEMDENGIPKKKRRKKSPGGSPERSMMTRSDSNRMNTEKIAEYEGMFREMYAEKVAAADLALFKFASVSEVQDGDPFVIRKREMKALRGKSKQQYDELLREHIIGPKVLSVEENSAWTSTLNMSAFVVKVNELEETSSEDGADEGDGKAASGGPKSDESGEP